jgi:phosphate-selective porin OprO/OprP
MAHLGVNGSYVVNLADNVGPDANGLTAANATTVQFRDRPELRNDATRLVDTGAINADHAWHWGLEGAFQHANFLVEGEYFRFGLNRRQSLLADPRFSGWYIEGSWLITGETRRYNAVNAVFDGPSPQYAWVPGSGGYGAWELAARYSDVNLDFRPGAAGTAPAADAVRGGEQQIWTVGLNWFVNNNIKFMLDFQDVRVDRLSPNAATFLTPVGAQIGQHYQAVAIRTQLGF